MKQGEIYLVDLDPVRGLEAAGRCLVAVVSNNAINASFLPITVAPLRLPVGGHIPRVYGVLVSAAESGLSDDMIVDCIQVRAIDQSRFPSDPIGVLPPDRMKDVEKVFDFVFHV